MMQEYFRYALLSSVSSIFKCCNAYGSYRVYLSLNLNEFEVWSKITDEIIIRFSGRYTWFSDLKEWENKNLALLHNLRCSSICICWFMIYLLVRNVFPNNFNILHKYLQKHVSTPP